MSDWNVLLQRLAELPRENGTAALEGSAAFLLEALQRAGLEAELVAFTATPYVLRLAGVLILAGALGFARLVFRGRFGAALAVAALVPVLLLLQLELYVPVFGWVGAQTQHHVVGRIGAPEPEQRLILTAHYDTKTDLLDHVARAPVDLLALPVGAAMLLGAAGAVAARRAGRRERAARALCRGVALAAAVYGGLAFLALTAGAFVAERSPGALDDGASCAVLVRVASMLASGPPLARTEVEIALLSAEEVGVQGSWALAAERFAEPPALPTFVVNLEGLGASARHGVLPRERFTLRSFAPDARLVALLDSVHRARLGAPLASLPVGGATDARSFLAHGVPAATLFSREPGSLFPRGLHSARDGRERLDEAALDASAAYLEAVVRAADARGL